MDGNGKFTGFVLILCFVFGFCAYKYRAKYNEQKILASSFEETITGLHTDFNKEKIRLNDSILLWQAEAKNLSYSKKNLEAQYNDLLKASKIRPKDVNSVTVVSTHTHSVDTVVAYVDTFGGIKAHLYDRWAKINVDIDKERQAIFDYSFKDSLSILTVQKKHSILFGLFKWKSHESTRVISHNPNAEIVGLQTVTIIK